jgi:DNA repair exonuclease SbcCD ATPase subunit
LAELRRSLFGYSAGSVGAVLRDRELMFERASTDARSAAERAERLAAELSEMQQRLDATEARATSAEDLAENTATELERSIAEREAMEAESLVVTRELSDAKTSLETATAMTAYTDSQLRLAGDRIAELEAQLAGLTGERDALGRDLADVRARQSGLEEQLRQRHEAPAAQQARIAELEELVQTYRAELEERAGASTAATAAVPEDPSTARELATVLQVTEEAVLRIMESTKARADEDLRRVDADRDRIRIEVDELVAWRDRAAPMIRSLGSTMDELLGQVSDIGPRVQEALSPATRAIGRLTSQLTSLDAVPVAAPHSRPDDESKRARVIELRDDRSWTRET